MAIAESGEMYLETILILSREKTDVRSIDIASHMGYSKPSISRAMSLLKKDGLIEMDEKGFISLTSKGHAIAEKILDRHEIMASLFIRLGVNKETAREDACKIEHVLSDETFDAVKRHLENL